LLRDKVRKAQDNIKELLRIFPEFKTISPEFKPVYLTRFLQVVLYPIVAAGFILCVFSQTIITLLLSAIFLGITFLFYKKAFNDSGLPETKLCLKDTSSIFALTIMVLILALSGYIFSKGKVRYTRA
jgi:hypothetical protein